MSWWTTTFGVLIGGGLAASLPVLIESLPDDPDLRVTVAAKKPFVVRDSAASTLPKSLVLPWPSPDGLTVTDTSAGAGLDLRTWGVTYSHRWERQVTLPVLTGPFIPEGQDVCGYALRLGAGLFDAHGAGAGIELLFRSKLSPRFGRDVDFQGRPFHLPALSSAHLHIVPQAGRFFVEVDLALVDGTRFAADFQARLDNDGGSPAIRRAGAVQGSWHMTPDLLIANTKAMEALFEQRLTDAEMFKHPIGSDGCTQTLPRLKAGGVHLAVSKEPRAPATPGEVLRLSIGVELLDNNRIDLRFRLRLVSAGPTPALELVDLDPPGLVGPAFDRLRGCARNTGAGYGAVVGLLGCFLGPWGCAAGVAIGAGAGNEVGEDRARALAFQTVNDQLKTKLGELNTELATSSGALITRAIDEGLQEANLGLASLRAPFAPLSAHPKDAVAVRLASVPSISPTGITLPLCARVAVDEAPVDPSVGGFPDLPGGPPAFLADLGPNASTVELQANADGIDQLLYFLWQSGTLRDLGTSRSVLDALPEEMRALAFEFKGFDPGLPPTVAVEASNHGAVGLALGDVKLGNWDGRRVVAHALGGVSVVPEGGDLGISYALTRLSANCAETTQGGTALTPCLSDLLPAIREQLTAAPSPDPSGASPCRAPTDATHPYRGPPAICVRGGEALSALTEQLGGHVRFSGLDAKTQGAPASITVSVRAQIGSGGSAPPPARSGTTPSGTPTASRADNDGSDANRPVLPEADRGFVDARGGWGWGDRCWTSMKAAKWGWAKAECDRGMAMNPASPQPRASLLYNEGLVAKQAGNVEEARQDFAASLALRENPEVRAALNSLGR